MWLGFNLIGTPGKCSAAEHRAWELVGDETDPRRPSVAVLKSSPVPMTKLSAVTCIVDDVATRGRIIDTYCTIAHVQHHDIFSEIS